MKRFESQLNYWTHMLDESFRSHQVDEDVVIGSISPNAKDTLLSLIGDDVDKAEKAKDAVVDDCLAKFITSNDDDPSIDFIESEDDADIIQIVINDIQPYHQGSYSYNAPSDLDYNGYGEESENYIQIKPANRMQLDKWMDDRGLSFELNEDPVDTSDKIIDTPFESSCDKSVKYTDYYNGKLFVVDKEKALNWISSL